MSQKAIYTKDHKNFDPQQWARLINSLSGFKSANLLGTVSKTGTNNLSIISSCFHLGANPPLMGFIVRPHSTNSPRHSFSNIKETGFYTLNHVTGSMMERAHQTSARYPEEISEFDICQLKEKYKDAFPAPFVAEAKIQIGLQLVEIKDIEINSTHLVIGKIENIYLPQKSIQKDGFIDLECAETICLSGLDCYHQTKRMTRLSYAKPDKPLTELSLSGEPLSE